MMKEAGKFRSSHRIAHWAAWAVLSLFVLATVLYVSALCDEHYQAHRAMRVYDQLLSVRIGDTFAEFDRKVPGCKAGEADGEYICFVIPVTERIKGRLDWFLMLEQEEIYQWQMAQRQRIGLRDWSLVSRVTMLRGRVSEINTQFFVVGRDQMLGCLWYVKPELGRARVGSNGPIGASTSLDETHITSAWAGLGYRMEFTPRSEVRDLHMREINGSCLTSFKGCSDSRELLPNVPPRGHPEFW